jgi:hypothetical protein
MGYLKMSAILLASTGLALSAAPAFAETATEPVRYSAEAFYNTTSFSMASPAGYGFSADGDKLLISSDSSGVFNAYALPVAGGKPVPVSSSADNATFAASYFPKDDRVLFTADKGGDELNHVYVRDADGTVRDLTPGEKVKADFIGWSADGGTFWVTTNERNPEMFDIYAYDTDDYERQRPLLGRPQGRLARAQAPDAAPGQCELWRLRLRARQPVARLCHQREGRVEPGLDLRSRHRRQGAADRSRLGRDVRRSLAVRPLPGLGGQ